METKAKPTDVIILAGGLGTRLKSEVPDLPKCLAPVANKPFIDHILSYFIDQGQQRFIFALGYLYEMVLEHIDTNWPNLNYSYTVENEPLGTGGAIALAATKVTSDDFLVLNGDTLFKIDGYRFYQHHISHVSLVTLALKLMSDFDRYGTVEVDETDKIVAFHEKKPCETGLINGGIYLINLAYYQSLSFPKKHSFEKDVLEAFVGKGNMYAQIFDDYFIDIGIPADFNRANHDLL